MPDKRPALDGETFLLEETGFVPPTGGVTEHEEETAWADSPVGERAKVEHHHLGLLRDVFACNRGNVGTGVLLVDHFHVVGDAEGRVTDDVLTAVGAKVFQDGGIERAGRLQEDLRQRDDLDFLLPAGTFVGGDGTADERGEVTLRTVEERGVGDFSSGRF